ncbi:MAG: (Fe-S)-binding protein [Desulfobacterales bacterium]|jgi:Fe-S oxidoreductase|nr:menaquinol oxidoreductase [Desulfobacter sp.]MDP6393926.1 (Fe-S)-binding protein [Desulfobacterales bacterium]MDP6683288.1 (Fe-S)-binding protein [Desulfobacterales bacterium]MDP6808592.1 (Fe-S)-binding protein [Desulfobacterales bacterium]|tara:strand:- start:40618 stop:42252 length:1635 start_codon:yes stop_codon:yes gene_type:complete
MPDDLFKSDELLSKLDPTPPQTGWMDTPVQIRKGMYCYASNPKSVEYVGLPNARAWNPLDDDWKLPENWEEIIFEGFRERLDRFRSFKVFMDICVRCGACADKCHSFIGTGDPKNMPVLRAELLRSVYRKDFTTAGKILGKLAGSRKLTLDVLKEWWYYFFQCTECRRCSVFCPFGIDTAEITMMARELFNLLGLNIDWIATPVANCYRTGNHLGIQPHAFKDMLDFFVDDIEDITGVHVEPSFNKKGADILFITPSSDIFADPGTYTTMGYLILFHFLKEQYGFDITWSTYASEGGNFGSFTSHETMKRLNSKMYAEAQRLGVKWILGGECGHMWRVIHQYMDTMNGPADFLAEPVSPITGTKFENAKATKVVHITEFTADLIKQGKLDLNPGRNDHLRVTYHDSCNTSRGMGLLDEPRYIIKNTCKNFYEMPRNTIREQTFCCGSGSGLNAGENMELRMAGSLPRANAVKYVHEKHDVNMLACICAIDRAALSVAMEYWVPDVDVTGVHELVGNALNLSGQNERTTDLRSEPIPGLEGDDGE